MLKSSYIKTHICEYFFTLMISFGFAINVASSFVIEKEVFGNYVFMILVVSFLNLSLFAAGINKKTTIAGIAIYVLAALSAMAYIVSTGKLISLEGEKSGYTLMAIILVVSTTFVYLITRNRKLFIVFIPVLTLVCAAFKFLEYPVSSIGFILLVVGAGLELIYKVYYESLIDASIGSYKIQHFMVQSIVIAIIVSCITFPVYSFIIKPADLPTREIKLTTKLLSWDVIEKIGISSKTEVLSDTIKSDKTTDKNLPKEEPEEKPTQENNDEKTQKQKTEVPAFAIKYNYKEPSDIWVFFIPFVILTIPFVIKYLLRKKRKRKIEELSPEIGCLYLYNYFLQKFKIAKIAKTDSLTLAEYVENNREDLSAFSLGTDVSFEQITDIYTREIYGGYIPSEHDYKMFKNFYYAFFKSMKDYIGKTRYIFKFWFL